MVVTNHVVLPFYLDDSLSLAIPSAGSAPRVRRTSWSQHSDFFMVDDWAAAE